jgi:hypothetical protein
VSTILREVAVALGLEVDSASFAEGELFAKAVEKGLEGLVEIGKKAVEFFVDVTKEAIESTVEIEHTAQAVGLTTDALQELLYVGSLTGVGMEEMAQSVGLLSRNMYAASKGGEEQGKVFAELKIKLKDAHGQLKAADDVIAEVAEKFKVMPDGAKKTALALELFGRAGKRMIPLLNEGSEGLAELREEARDLGVVLDEETVKQGVEVEHNVKRLEALWEGIKRKAGASIFPVLKQLTDGAVAWVKANREVIKQKLEVVLKAIARGAKFLIDAFDVLYGSIKLIVEGIVGLLQWFWKLDSGIRAYVIGFVAAGTLAAAPWLLWVAALAAVLLILNSIRRFLEGKDSLFADWMKMLDEWSQPKKNDPWWLAAIKELVQYMERAIGIADKLDLRFGPKKRAPAQEGGVVNTALKIGEAAANIGEHLVPRPDFVKNFDKRTEDAKGRGASWWQQLQAGFGGGEFAAPTLPPGQGVMSAAPVSIQRSYNIYQAPGMSAADVVNLIQQHEDAANEEAAAALGD